MEIKEIISQLEYNTGSFPEKAVKAAAENRERIIPELLNALKTATLNANVLLNEPSYFLHIFALYLLAQFREKEAYPLICDFFKIPGETVFDLTGDIITEDLCRILACVYDGDTSLIKSLIENPEQDEYIRSSALESLLCLALWGEISMEVFTDYLYTLFRGKISRDDDSYLWTGMTCCVVDLGLIELQKDITKAFDDGLIDSTVIDFGYVNRGIGGNKEKKFHDLKNNRRYTPIEDTVKELKWWACFNEDDQSMVSDLEQDSVMKSIGGTFTRTGQKISRNEPCPCGSGKKYKKCCLK